MEKSRYDGLIALVGAFALITAGLIAYVMIDFRADSDAARADRLLAETGLNGTARVLSEDIAEGDMMLAYHHASEAAEYARLAGNAGAAELFGEITDEIREGRLEPRMAAAVDGFVASGVLPDEMPFFEYEPVDTAAVSVDVYEAAEECAERFFGGAIMTRGQRLSNGEILFSSSNAYAVIDGQRCVPIEACISLDAGGARIGAQECAARAMEFIADFFPESVSRSAVVTRVDMSDGRRADVYAQAAGASMCVTVRRDTGRVVRFVNGAR